MKRKLFVLLTALILICTLLPQSVAADSTTKFSQRPVITTATASETSVKIGWTKVSGAAGYEVYRALPDKPFRKIKTIKNGNTLQYIDKGLRRNAAYYYRIKAYKVVKGKKVYGRYSWSEQGTAGIIEGLRGFSAYISDKEAIYLHWYCPDGTDGALIYRSVKKASGYKLIAKVKTDVNGGGDEYVDRKVEAGKTYYYKACPYVTYKGAAIKGKFTKVSTRRAMHDNPKADVTITPFGEKELIFKVTMKTYGYGAEFFIIDTEDSFLGKIELYQTWKDGTAEEHRETLLKITGLSDDGKDYRTNGSLTVKPGETVYIKTAAGEPVAVDEEENLEYDIYCHYKGEYSVIHSRTD